MNIMKPKETEETTINNWVRKATLDDAFAITKVHLDTQKYNYRDILDQEFLENMNFESRVQKMQDRLEKKESVIYVKELDGKIVWFIDGGVSKAGVPYEAEIYTIYIDPKFQGKGVGKELMYTIMNDDFFKDKKSLYLWTLKESPQSRGFYDKLWGKVFTEKYEEIGGKKYLMVGYYRQK